MNWRRLRPGELDHEMIWLGVSLGALAWAWCWLYFHVPIPQCVFHRFTGLPCPTCGVTRCLRYTFHRDLWAAAGTNPFAFFGFGAVAVYDIYAAIVLLFRLPRLRFDVIPARIGRLIRYTAITAILGNWAWLVWMRV